MLFKYEGGAGFLHDTSDYDFPKRSRDRRVIDSLLASRDFTPARQLDNSGFGVCAKRNVS
jgi:hypothetical protein